MVQAKNYYVVCNGKRAVVQPSVINADGTVTSFVHFQTSAPQAAPASSTTPAQAGPGAPRPALPGIIGIIATGAPSPQEAFTAVTKLPTTLPVSAAALLVPASGVQVGTTSAGAQWSRRAPPGAAAVVLVASLLVVAVRLGA